MIIATLASAAVTHVRSGGYAYLRTEVSSHA